MDDVPMRAESLNELLRAESLNIRRVLKDHHNMQALYEPADPDQPATVWGLLIFLPAAFAAAGLASQSYPIRHPWGASVATCPSNAASSSDSLAAV